MDMNMEVPIEGFEGYFVRPDGTVLSDWKGRKRCSDTRVVMKPCIDRDGYVKLSLRVAPGVAKTKKVHQLVLTAFHGPNPGKMQVCHLDHNKTNNAITNLMWGTAGENARQKFIANRCARLMGERNGRSKLTTNNVLEIRALADAGVRSCDIAMRFGISVRNVWDIVHKRIWKHLPSKELAA